MLGSFQVRGKRAPVVRATPLAANLIGHYAGGSTSGRFDR
jgi:hypothetical protein